MAYYQKLGRAFQPQTTPVTVSGHQGLMSTYTASSPISGEERGRLILVQDGSGGYYEFWAFSPGPETETYRAVLDSILTNATFSTKLYATDLYSGTIHNRTADKSAQFEVKIRNDDGKLAGCVGIVKPLYGSGPLEGLMKDGTVTFSVRLNAFDLDFRAKSEDGKLVGTYTVSPTAGSSASAQDGEFSLERAGSKPLLLRPCPTDADMNATGR
jgi:hypothetical protein